MKTELVAKLLWLDISPSEIESARHVEADFAVGLHMRPEQRREAPTVGGCELVESPGLRKDVLEHERVDVHE